MDESRILNDDDLAGFGRRVADYARARLEAKLGASAIWNYLPSFRDEVAVEALAILKVVVQHERQQSNHDLTLSLNRKLVIAENDLKRLWHFAGCPYDHCQTCIDDAEWIKSLHERLGPPSAESVQAQHDDR